MRTLLILVGAVASPFLLFALARTVAGGAEGAVALGLTLVLFAAAWFAGAPVRGGEPSVHPQRPLTEMEISR